MTADEAKMQIQAIPEKIWDQLSEPDREAMEMAFSALQEHELSKNSPELDKENGELIRKKAAIEALKEAFNPSITNFVKAKMAIDNLPSAQSEKRTEERTETHACDLIDRQAAQTELMMKCERYTLAKESHGMGHVEWSSDLISVADAMNAIRWLPSATPERRKGK